jgi:hypothetical protein
MTAPIWPWAGSHLSSDWPWLHNVSTSATFAKGEDYREGRHFMLFRVSGGHVLNILRLLHENMDLIRHLPVINNSPQ